MAIRWGKRHRGEIFLAPASACDRRDPTDAAAMDVQRRHECDKKIMLNGARGAF
jgi:hypothetical protein